METLSRARLMGISGSLPMAVIYIIGLSMTILRYLDGTKLDLNSSLILMYIVAEISLSIIGTVVLGIAIYHITKAVKDHSIFKNYLLGLGIILAAVLTATLLLFFLARIDKPTGVAEAIRMAEDASGYMKLKERLSDITALRFRFTAIFLPIAYIAIVIGYHYLRKSYVAVGKAIGTNLFSLAGNFLFWGAVFIIGLGLGSIVMRIGVILLLFAFIKMPVATPKAYGS